MARPGCLLIGLLLLVTACAPTPTTERGADDVSRPSRPARTLVASLGHEPDTIAAKTLSPTGGGGGVALYLTRRMFNADLALIDDAGVPRPYLAEALPQLNTDSWRVFPDGRMETMYRLRPGLAWHDGTPLTSADFVFSFQVYSTPQLTAVLPPVSLIEEVLAPDDRTLLIRWKRPYTMANALNSAGTGAPDNFPPLPRANLQGALDAGSPDAILNHPYWTRDFVGLGPYRLQNWIPGSFLETVAFGQHALGSPKIERVKLLIVPDDNAVIPFLLTGEIQLAPADGGVGAGRVRTVLEQLGPGRGTAILHPNQWRRIEAQFRPEYVSEPALLDPRVRRALAFAIDKAAINEAVYDGQAVPADSMIPPASQDGRAADAVIAKYPYDLRRAEEQMAAAGYTKGPDGFYTSPASGRLSSEIKSNAGANTVAEMTILASGWRQAGFSMQDAVLPAALGQDPEARASFAGLFTNSGNLQGAINFKATLFPGSPNRLQNESRGGWSNAEYAQLSDAFNTTLDASERTRLTVDMMRIFSDQLPAISLFFGAQAWVFLSDLQGPNLVASETNMSWNIHEWDMR